MIRLIKEIPSVQKSNAEWIKIKCLYDCYKNDSSVMFWEQNEGDALISFTDGNMIIYNRSAAIDELCEFVDIISPCCVFSDINTLWAINRIPDEEIFVCQKSADLCSNEPSDILSSKDLYELLDVKGLSLPDYPHFAVDYCRRLNHGFADYFSKKDLCAAISFNTENYAIMNGIASHKKGFGSVALQGILSKNVGREFLVCCRNSVLDFYLKNGFKILYSAGYWVKNK